MKECYIIDERPVDPIFSNSFLGKCAEGIEHSEQHSVLRNDCQYNESSGTELESASVTNSTTLKNLHRDEAAEGTFNLSHGQTSKR